MYKYLKLLSPKVQIHKDLIMALAWPSFNNTGIFMLFLFFVITNSHPLDSLSPTEITMLNSIIRNSTLVPFSKTLNFHYVSVLEPAKEIVLDWLKSPEKSPEPPRRAYVLARGGFQIYQINVSLTHGSVESYQVYKGNGFPIVTGEEMAEVQDVVLQYQPYVSSIKKRGLDIDMVVSSPFSIGWFGENDGKRLVRIITYYKGGSPNIWVRPVDGIRCFVDLDIMKVVEYEDVAVHILPKAENTDYRAFNMKPPFVSHTNRISVVQPDGPTFKIDGQQISWAGWKLHLKFDARAGTVISLAQIFDVDQGLYRSVLYKGYVSEMFVPYMDPTEEWYSRTFLDTGEYGNGLSAISLEPLTDCPPTAVFIDGYYASAHGVPVQLPNAFCVFERYSGDVAWRHTESATLVNGKTVTEVRPEVTLVIRMVSTVGNYDYVFDWEFKQNGAIKVGVALSGMIEVKSTEYTHTDEAKEDIYGTLVADNTIGVNHDHYLTYYLDLDVDGQQNSFVKSKLTPMKTYGSSARKSYWTAVKRTLKSELEARMHMNEPGDIIITNPNKKTRLGNEIGYKIVSSNPAAPIIDEEDYSQIRASFTNFPIFVTPHNPSEQWAGGELADRSHGDDTLFTWTNRDRNIENKDLVLWHTLGFYHNPCQEDFPIMPTLSGGFELKPVNFFERNPILKIRPLQQVNIVCNFNNTASPYLTTLVKEG